MENILSKKKDLSFKGITCDSRKVKPGYAFVAIKGFKEDGNNHIDEAISRGAKIVFSEKSFDSDKFKDNIQFIEVEDSRKTLGKMAASFYDFPSTKLKVIGVTGTNGKTTTTHLIYNLLNFERKKSGLIGTVKVDNGQKVKPGDLTTPPPVLLQKLLHEMVKNKLKYGCMEVSSHGIKLKRIEGTKFAVKVGINVTKDHFDLHSNIENYKTVKKSFLTTDNNALVLMNNDDSFFNQLGQIAKNQINFGINNTSPVEAKKINYNNIKTKFIYHLHKPLKNLSPCHFPVEMIMPGKHNIYNALITITIGLYYGLQPLLIQNFFRNYTGVWRRLQVIYNNKFTIIDDCAHNPGSYQAVFKTIENLNFHKLHIVNSLRGNRGIKINKANARTISVCLKNRSYNLLTSNCTEVIKTIDKVTEKEEKIFLQTLNNHQIKYTHYQKLEPALRSVLKEVNKGDLILLLGPHAMDNAGKIILEMI